MKPKLPSWTPLELRSFLGDGEGHCLDRRDLELFMRFATDLRMRDFWEWVEKKNEELSGQGYELNPVSLFWAATRGLKPLDKPSDLPPKRKEKYLSDVQHHAQALLSLLRGTTYDLPIEKFCELSGLDRAGVQEMFDLPECTLIEQLQDVLDWAQKPDCHDSAGNPTWMIRQGGESARKHFLAAKLLRIFQNLLGSPPPAEKLGILMTVILEAEPEISTDAAQKLMERLKERGQTVRYEKIDGSNNMKSLSEKWLLSMVGAAKDKKE